MTQAAMKRTESMPMKRHVRRSIQKSINRAWKCLPLPLRRFLQGAIVEPYAPWEEAALKGDTAKLLAILKTKDAPGGSSYWQDAMNAAIAGGQVETARALLTEGSALDPGGLEHAIVAGKLACVQLFVERGADVGYADESGNTPLLFAAGIEDGRGRPRCYPEILCFLLNQGTELNHTNKVGDSALIAAAKRGNAKGVRVLLEAGAVIDVKNQQGFNALGIAVTKGRPDIVSLLLRHGADVNAGSVNGEYLLTIAERNHEHEIADMLKSAATK